MNQKGFVNVILIIVIVAVIAVGGYFVFVKKSEPVDEQKTSVPTQNGNTILSELKRLNIDVTGPPKMLDLELPTTLSDADWGMKKTVCEDGGYNLSAYAGKTLSFASYPISELWNNTEPLNAWVVTSGNNIVCVYKAVREGSNLTPGIFPVGKK